MDAFVLLLADGRGYALMQEDGVQLVADLRQTLDRGGDLTLQYLPEVSLATGHVIGLDALARWRHPTRGDIPPRVFIPLAESAGLIGALTEWVVKTAFRQCRVWRRRRFASAGSGRTTALCSRSP